VRRLQQRSRHQGEDKESVELLNNSHGPVVEFATFRARFGDTTAEQLAADPDLSTTEGVSKKHNLEGTDTPRGSNIANLGCHSKLESEEYSDTNSTAITMLSGYMFTHQLRELPAEADHEEHYRCEKENDDQSILSAFSDRPRKVLPTFPWLGMLVCYR
jgi:hypothetical protein